MGMLGHAMAAMIKLQNGDLITGECWLANEEYVKLTMDTSLFSGCKKSAEIPDRILKGFVKGFVYCEEEAIEAAALIRDSDVMDIYASFEKKVARLAFSKICTIVLMSCVEQEYEDHKYVYTWIKYDLVNEDTSYGSGTGESEYDLEKFLKTL